MQLCSNLNILWPCSSLRLEWKLTFSDPVSLIQVQSLWVCCDFYSHVLEMRTLRCSGEVTVAQTVGDGAGIHYYICLSILCLPPHFPLKTSGCNCQVCWWMSRVRIMIKDSLFTGHMLQLKLHQNFPQMLGKRERAFCEHLVCDQFMWEPREGAYLFIH